MSSFVLPNRKTFADYITRIFLKYRKLDGTDDDEGVDKCLQTGQKTRELLPYQKLIRDYLQIETPYRGVLVYHGLGSGKTYSAIGVAESLLSNKNVYVMLPASLQSNFRQEIRKSGNPIYTLNNYWEVRIIRSDAEKQPALALGISDDFLRKQGRYFVTVAGKETNYNTLPSDIRKGIEEQITDIIDNRYTFINYNGLNSESVKLIVPEEDPKTSKKFDNSVVIIDEAHNLISRVINRSEIARRLYDAIYYAKDCKVVLLSGTPVINRPNEIAFLMNLLRGPIERIILPVKEMTSWDEAGMTTYFKKMPEIDNVEFNSIKRLVYIVRNPPHFKTVYSSAGDRIAVQYDESLSYKTPGDWVDGIRETFSASFSGGVLAAREYIQTEYLECLPTNFQEFVNTFVDGLEIKNSLMFQKRIQGLVSYYKGADERMLPKRVDDDKMLEKIEMSSDQYNRYLEVRWKEIQQESKKSLKGPSAMNEDFSSYRVVSRLVCNYAVPPELREDVEGQTDENKEGDKSRILARLKENPDRFLRDAGLAVYSPKLQKLLQNVKANDKKNQFIYSQYRELEGLGIFGAILEANGYQQYKLVLDNGRYLEDPSLDPEKPSFAFYTGKEDAIERELVRYIFNEEYSSIQLEYPQHFESIKSSIKARLCILMASSSGAEGINLKNVRHLHIMEPYWNPARHDQVIGRGIRLCSHATRQVITDGVVTTEVVPLEERTIRVSFYMSVFSKEQAESVTAPNIVAIRRADSLPKRYDNPDAIRPPEAFMTSDEFLYNIAYEKGRLSSAIIKLLKQAAVDCEIHRKLHSREKPVIQCLRFDSQAKGEDTAFHSNIKDDERDASYLRNLMKRGRRLQRIKIKEIVFLVDPDSKEVFDEPAFGDANRLLKLGTLEPDRIKFFNY
jgi:Type III restriction enzyme, res subunit/Helicase conserved C-terminal domain